MYACIMCLFCAFINKMLIKNISERDMNVIHECQYLMTVQPIVVETHNCQLHGGAEGKSLGQHFVPIHLVNV